MHRITRMIVVTAIILVLTGCPGLDETVRMPIESVAYEDLAKAVDQGHMSEYLGRRLRIRGHVRAYGYTDDIFIVIGKRLPDHQYPTMLCTVPSSEYEKAVSAMLG